MWLVWFLVTGNDPNIGEFHLSIELCVSIKLFALAVIFHYSGFQMSIKSNQAITLLFGFGYTQLKAFYNALRLVWKKLLHWICNPVAFKLKTNRGTIVHSRVSF